MILKIETTKDNISYTENQFAEYPSVPIACCCPIWQHLRNVIKPEFWLFVGEKQTIIYHQEKIAHTIKHTPDVQRIVDNWRTLGQCEIEVPDEFCISA